MRSARWNVWYETSDGGGAVFDLGAAVQAAVRPDPRAEAAATAARSFSIVDRKLRVVEALEVLLRFLEEAVVDGI